MRLINEKFVDAGDMGASITGATQDIQHMGMASVHAVWTGTPTGTVTLQKSINGSDWENVVAGTAAGGAGGTKWWDIADIGFPYLRLTYTRSSGSGTINAWLSAKGF